MSHQQSQEQHSAAEDMISTKHAAPRDERLLGKWRLDHECKQPEYIEDTTAEFTPNGALTYRYLHEGVPSSITLRYQADGCTLLTQGSVSGKEGKATYAFNGDGNLLLTSESQTVRYFRV